MKRTSVSSTEVVGALDADGVILASAELDSAAAAGRDVPDRVWLMREDDVWALLTLHQVLHYEDPYEDHPDQGSIQLRLVHFPTLGAVAAHVERNYAGDAWYKLLSHHGAWSPDDELASAWVAIHAPRRLAKVTFGLLALPRDMAVACLAEVVSGIKNDAWQSSALAFVAERIGAGSSPFEVPDIEHPALLPLAYDHIHRPAGALVVEAWDHRLSVVIRFGGRGLYVAMAEDGETSQPPIQLLVV